MPKKDRLQSSVENKVIFNESQCVLRIDTEIITREEFADVAWIIFYADSQSLKSKEYPYRTILEWSTQLANGWLPPKFKSWDQMVKAIREEFAELIKISQTAIIKNFNDKKIKH